MIPTNIYSLPFLLHITWNLQIQVSTNMPIVGKPRNFVPMKLNDFTVLLDTISVGVGGEPINDIMWAELTMKSLYYD